MNFVQRLKINIDCIFGRTKVSAKKQQPITNYIRILERSKQIDAHDLFFFEAEDLGADQTLFDLFKKAVHPKYTAEIKTVNSKFIIDPKEPTKFEEKQHNETTAFIYFTPFGSVTRQCVITIDFVGFKSPIDFIVSELFHLIGSGSLSEKPTKEQIEDLIKPLLNENISVSIKVVRYCKIIITQN